MIHVSKKNLFVSLIVLSLLPEISWSQIANQDILYLRDSSVIRGTIFHQEVDSIIKIQIIGGSILAINKDMVVKVSQGPILEHGITPFHQEEKGYSNYTELGMIFSNQPGFFLETVNGYRFKKHFFTGAGLRMDITNIALLNIFANGKWEILNKRSTPYLYANAGYGIPIYFDPDIYYEKTTYLGGITYGAGAGMRFKFYGDGAFLVSMGYKHNKLIEKVTNTVSSSESEFTYSQMTMSVGVSF